MVTAARAPGKRLRHWTDSKHRPPKKVDSRGGSFHPLGVCGAVCGSDGFRTENTARIGPVSRLFCYFCIPRSLNCGTSRINLEMVGGSPDSLLSYESQTVSSRAKHS